MQLMQALRLGYIPRLALDGSGGKTTAMFHLGRELIETHSGRGAPTPTVLLAATTHMAIEQLDRADWNIFLETTNDVAKLQAELPKGLVLLTGPQAEEERTAGLPMPVMDNLRHLADEHQLPLLIEADGSRQKPLKAHAEHEPVIPAWVDIVVVVCGLSGIGKPLSMEWVHRPERFARLASLSIGDPVTPEALVQVLTNQAGGLKGIPSGARRVALLNQAETLKRPAAVNWLVEHLLPIYHAVVIAALAPSTPECSQIIGIGEESSHLSTPRQYSAGEEGCIYAVHEPVAGIILAAGSSSRMGRVKQALLWRGEPLVKHVARTALAAGLSPVVVVTGSSAGEVETAIQGLSLSIVHNADWQAGQSTSVITGLRALPPETGAAIFLLADQPQAPVGLVQALKEMHAVRLSPIVAPQVQGKRANPVLFDRRVFSDLLSLTGDMGGRMLFSRYPVTWLPWQDASITLDIDTLDDYHRLLEI